MKITELVLDMRSLANLAEHLGSSWEAVAGSALGSGMIAVESVAIRSTAGVSTIVTMIVNPEEAETLASLSVTDDGSEFYAAIESGDVYTQYRGQTIKDIVVVHDTMTETEHRVETWRCEADVAIVFVLDDGVIAITKHSNHMEVLKVMIGSELSSLPIPELSDEWQSDILTEYSATRRYTSIRELLGCNYSGPWLDADHDSDAVIQSH